MIQSLGRHVLKGFEEPIEALSIDLDPDAEPPTPDSAASPRTLPDRSRLTPAIAVLTFENRSSDEDQQYLAEGLAEDIAAALSRLRWLTVIARSSTRQYSSDVDTIQLGSELNVDFVVRGSVRRGGERLRVNVTLEATRTDEQVWSERYDRLAGDIFEIEDDICEQVLGRLEVEIGVAEQQRVRSVAPATLTAWEAYQRGLAALQGLVGVGLSAAKAHFRRAIELDAEFAAPKAALVLALVNELNQSVTAPVQIQEATAEARMLAAQAVQVDPRESLGYVARARLNNFLGQSQTALNDAEIAITLNPNSASAYLVRAEARVMSEDPEGPKDALVDLDTAIRLSPLDPHLHSARFAIAALAYLRLGNFEEAARSTEIAMQVLSNPVWSSALATVAHCALGNPQRATEIAQDLLERHPNFTISRFIGHRTFGGNEFHDWILGRLRDSGLPD